MSSDSFKTFLVKDATIGDITSDLDYAVQQGAANKTFQSFVATSTSNSSVTFNVNVPSENVVVDRGLLVQVPLTFTLQTAPATAIGQVCPIWGGSIALNAFPYNMLQQTCTVSINNTSQSMNVQDVLPQLLRMNDSRELYRYNGMTPSLPDQAFQQYADGGGSNNNPLADYSNCSYDNAQVSRGAFPVSVKYYQFASGATLPYGGLSDEENLTSQAVGAYWKIVVSTVVTEPVFVSPFSWGQPSHNAMGLLGVNNITITQNIDATLKRLVSWGASTAPATSNAISAGATLYDISASPATVISTNTNLFNLATGSEYFSAPSQPTLLLNFLSVQASEQIASKNCVPLMDYPRYITPANSGTALATGVLTRVQSSNLQLNQIPDLLLIAVRKPMASQTIADADVFFKINAVSINFNNASGLLSSASAQDLWRISSKNGSQQNWLEFGGLAWKSQNTAADSGAMVATTGSLLVINPAMDLSLPPYLSNGSLGQFSLQMSLDIANLSSSAVVPEIIITCVNSGVFVTQQGSSMAYTGILTREMVLASASSKEWKSSVEEGRLTGGMLLNRGAARKAMRHKMMGGVPSGGALSGGALSGGARTKLSGMY